MTRQSYRHELVTMATLPVATAMVEGGVVGVLANKAFHVGPYLFALIWAAPMFANLTSIFWSKLAHGRAKIRVIRAIQVGILLTIGAIALLPTQWPGPLLLAGLVIISRFLLAGMVTLRSTVWRMNYPRHVRGRITGRLAMLDSLIKTIAPFVGYALLDIGPNMFRVLYPAVLLVGVVGVMSFSKVRLRRERELLRDERELTERPEPGTRPVLETEAQADAAIKPGFWAILKGDLLFRRYMIAQFLAGMANIGGETAIVAFISTRLTEGLKLEYMIAILLTMTIPKALGTLTLPSWAKRLDGMHIAAFRVRQAKYWIYSQGLNWIGAVLLLQFGAPVWLPLTVVALGRLAQGVGGGAGLLAWQLGHNDFAERRLVSAYMGVHVMLAGVRGATVPFLAMALYDGWGTWRVPGTDWVLPEWAGLGPGVFLVTLGLAVGAVIGFARLSATVHEGGAIALPAD
ncbi:MAG: MFS transporter [Phycisphaeraceae bacterium]